MRKPFVLRVQNDDPSVARAIAQALLAPLRRRGARVRAEGLMSSEEAGAGDGPSVHMATSARGLKGTSIALGILDAEQGARWLSPLETSDEPAAAAAATLSFLETWGFVAADPRAPAARPKYAS